MLQEGILGSQVESGIRCPEALLTYQIEELETLNPQPGELEALEAQHKLLANAAYIIDAMILRRGARRSAISSRDWYSWRMTIA